MKSIYVTTPIFYVNDLPHIGHAYTVLICDSIARYYKLKGYSVLFTTGTDEHGLKVEKAAKRNQKPTQIFVDEVSSNFKKLTKTLNVCNTDFVRTTEERHKESARTFWRKLEEKNYIYLSKYKGWYSVKDETFYQEKELFQKDGCFYTHDNEKVEWVEEESYFFKLSDFQDNLMNYYENNPDFVQPLTRMNEVKSFVNSGLKDLSISRTSFEWGIKIPKSEKHIMYVWIDALTNYLTSLGYPNVDPNDNPFWKECIHVIGKDIIKFHAVYWPAMLMAADYHLPKNIIAHGWWTNEGKKISKSVGNTINPDLMIEKFGLEQFRYFLLREVSLGNDGDFSEISFINRINADLSNNLGNLIQRVTKFISKNYNSKIPFDLSQNQSKIGILEDGYKMILKLEKLMENFELSRIVEEIFHYINRLNRLVDQNQPWKVFKEDPHKAGYDLSILVEAFRIVSILLQPIIPQAASKILDILNINKNERTFECVQQNYSLPKDHSINSPEPIFPRYEK